MKSGPGQNGNGGPLQKPAPDWETDWPDRRPATAWTRVSRPQAVILVVACLALGLGLYVWTRVFFGREALTLKSESSPGVVLRPARINLNTAPWYELSLLPGIGEKKAKTIVEYRTANGPFRDLDELMKVKGIGPKTLESLKPLVTLSDSE